MSSERAASEYEQLSLRLSQAVSRICPSWLSDRRDDIAQAAVIKLIKMVERSEGRREFSSFYLRRLAYSALVDEIRRIRRRKESAIEDVSMELAETREDHNPYSATTAAEIGRGITDCLKQMVRPRRIAVTLHLQGYSVPELAGLLRWTPKKAENLVYRGLAALRDCLAAKGLKP